MMTTSAAPAIYTPPRVQPELSVLVRQTRAGDPEALGALYDQFAERLYHTAARLCSSLADAQDVVHDVFVGLPEALHRYEERGHFEAWLRRLTVRTALMYRRRNSRRREDALGEAMHGLPHIAATAHVSSEWGDIQRAIAALPDQLRDVLVLKELEGFSHDEIGRLLRISAGASRVRLNRALTALRAALAASR